MHLSNAPKGKVPDSDRLNDKVKGQNEKSNTILVLWHAGLLRCSQESFLEKDTEPQFLFLLQAIYQTDKYVVFVNKK